MKETTLCYLEQNGKYLLLYRNAKKADINHGKWIGVGGKIEPGETPEQCVRREVREETGLSITSYRYRGIVNFRSDDVEERMHLFTADAWVGTLSKCDEGELKWVAKSALETYPTWEGDAVFLRAIERDDPFFILTLTYQRGRLIGTHMEWPPTST